METQSKYSVYMNAENRAYNLFEEHKNNPNSGYHLITQMVESFNAIVKTYEKYTLVAENEIPTNPDTARRNEAVVKAINKLGNELICLKYNYNNSLKIKIRNEFFLANGLDI